MMNTREALEERNELMMSDLDAREVLEDRSGTEQRMPTDAGESDETADGP